MTGPSSKTTNRLIREKSPYLLQHAHNPVDWYPWGDEAFQKARDENKPILLSVGYSTCHWCHVMERESFEDAQTAELMNRHFVSVKVDREERPDVDSVYMAYVTATAGHGGWPMTVFLTPDAEPFYGGTYFPPSDRYGMPGFKTLLGEIAAAWRERREEIGEAARSAVKFLSRSAQASDAEIGLAALEEAFRRFERQHDPAHGGFGRGNFGARPSALLFLLRHWKRTGSPSALEIARKTLDAIEAGGIHDQIGGGFHRYSTDNVWRVPHFEKMLYDQALLVLAYVEAFQATREPRYERAARAALDYVLREMTSPEGGFYSAQDADSADPLTGEKKEGAFFLWTPGELRSLFDAKTADALAFRFGVEEAGNAPNDPHGEFAGKSVLYLARSLDETAARLGTAPEAAARLLEDAVARLFAERAKRPAPHLDDKVLADWNGLMISAFASASRVFSEARYRVAASRAGLFALKHLKAPGGRLLHRYRDGEAAFEGGLNDYAFLCDAFVSLYEATFDESWLAEARALAETMTQLFWDEEAGGFFMTASDAERLVARPKEYYDGAVPSGNSAGASALLRLERLTGDASLGEFASKLFRSAAGQAAEEPTAYPQLLAALDFALGPVDEIVFAGRADDAGLAALLDELYRVYRPNKTVAFHKEGPSGGLLERLAPHVAALRASGGRLTAYVCRGRACSAPAHDASEFAARLA